jgi:Ca2+-binding EF-hand superfamily protein
MDNNTLRDEQAIRAKRLRQLLSQSQKNDIKKAFDYFDQDGSGKIKRKELKVILRALGFDPSNDSLEDLVSKYSQRNAENIDFQEFMDIMLAKIDEKLTNDDIKYAFKKISSLKTGVESKYISSDDIDFIAEQLEEKLTKEEIEEMLLEAHEAGKLLDEEKNKSKKKDVKEEPVDKRTDRVHESDGEKKKDEEKRTINLHEFKAILNWEKNN